MTNELISLDQGRAVQDANVWLPGKWTFAGIDSQLVLATSAFVGQANGRPLAIECQLKRILLVDITSIALVRRRENAVHVHPVVVRPTVERRILVRTFVVGRACGYDAHENRTVGVEVVELEAKQMIAGREVASHRQIGRMRRCTTMARRPAARVDDGVDFALGRFLRQRDPRDERRHGFHLIDLHLFLSEEFLLKLLQFLCPFGEVVLEVVAVVLRLAQLFAQLG